MWTVGCKIQEVEKVNNIIEYMHVCKFRQTEANRRLVKAPYTRSVITAGEHKR